MKSIEIELELEVDGRWIAEMPALPGVMAYGQTREEAVTRVQALASRVLADRLEYALSSEGKITSPFLGAAHFGLLLAL